MSGLQWKTFGTWRCFFSFCCVLCNVDAGERKLFYDRPLTVLRLGVELQERENKDLDNEKLLEWNVASGFRSEESEDEMTIFKRTER